MFLEALKIFRDNYNLGLDLSFVINEGVIIQLQWLLTYTRLITCRLCSRSEFQCHNTNLIADNGVIRFKNVKSF